MMALSAIKLRLQNELASHLSRKPAHQPVPRPTISFTFDDFPRSALLTAGKMLTDYGVRGTYYSALGLMGTRTAVGDIFESGDLEAVLSAGHELACHTFDHVRSCDVSKSELVDNCRKNQRRVADAFGGYCLRNFSFPLGVITPSAKSSLSSLYETCRTIEPGINQNTIDLGYLRANRVYSQFGTARPLELIQHNRQQKGWAIFYTHDVSDRPSPYGCTPQQFHAVLKAAVESGADVLPVFEARKRFATAAR